MPTRERRQKEEAKKKASKEVHNPQIDQAAVVGPYGPGTDHGVANSGGTYEKDGKQVTVANNAGADALVNLGFSKVED